MDGKLQEVLLDYGLEGYGLYWYCLELIAAKVTPEKLTFDLDHDARIIARNTGSSTEKVQQMMTRFVDLKLFENNEGTITCLKIAKRADDYTAKLLKTQVTDLKLLSSDVGESPIKSDKNEKRLPKRKENKLNKNIQEQFDSLWEAYPKKSNKKPAFKSFTKINPDDDLFKKIMDGLNRAKKSDQWKKDNGQFIPMASTWLNNERWEDEIDSQAPASLHQSHRIFKAPEKPIEVADPEKARQALGLVKQSLKKMP